MSGKENECAAKENQNTNTSITTATTTTNRNNFCKVLFENGENWQRKLNALHNAVKMSRK